MPKTLQHVRTGIAVVVLGLVGACIAPDLVPCGELSCAAGSVCTVGGCASPEAVTACEGLLDGAACAANQGGAGTCVGGACRTGLCGNGVLDPGELCDGELGVNALVGEKCGDNCQRIDVCGNSVVDPGEQCDDGNTNPADGCDACMFMTWQAVAVIGANFATTAASLASPYGVAADHAGNVYIADSGNHLIRRIGASGGITTIAGTGTSGGSGDGGTATSAQLDTPFALAIDGLGRLYIADTYGQRIRRIDAQGIITTIAGTGTVGFSGDGGAATSALLSYPEGVAVDGLGNIYIADRGNQRIRRVDSNGTITSIAGTGTHGFSGDGSAATSATLAAPSGVAVDSLGNVYIAETDNQRIRRIDSTGTITTFAGGFGSGGDGGPATSASLNNPWAVSVDDHNVVYIADTLGQRIRRVDTNGIITTVAGTGDQGFGGDGSAATSAQLSDPFGVAVDDAGNLYIADTDNGRIRRVDATGVITTIAGAPISGAPGDGGAATSARLARPGGVALDAVGNLYIADTNDNCIRRVDRAGVITTIAGTGTAGNSGDGSAATSAQLAAPSGIAVDSQGNLYIADTNNASIRRVDVNGVITTVAGNGTNGYGGDGGPATSAQLAVPFGVAVDGQGTIYIADTFNDCIRRVDATGMITTVAGGGAGGDGGAATNASLDHPWGVAVDVHGNIYIADSHNQRIRRVDTNGIITTIAGTGSPGFNGDGGLATSAQVYDPFGIAVDASGNVYIADTDGERIRRIDPTGIITTIAGISAYQGFSFDGGLATNAELSAPYGVAVAAQGDIYIADTWNDRVRRVDTSGVIATIAGAIDPSGMGPFAQARLLDPRALVVAPQFTLVSGGSSGTVQAARFASASLGVVAGRYPQAAATGSLARFRTQGFGEIDGVAYDEVAHVLYMSESSANRIHAVTVIDPDDANTWTIVTLTGTAGTAGFADGPASTAKFRDPTGLYFDSATRQLYVADTGNHVVRAIDLSAGVASATVRTVAGTPKTLGMSGDGGVATSALMYEPRAITRCANGDLFIADTRNNRVRRVAAGTGMISTVLGDGVAASSGEGRPASTFPVDAPLGLACDAIGNLFTTSSTAVRMLPSDANGAVDGTGNVETIYGAPPRSAFPASVTSCLTGLAVSDATTVEVIDSCTGLLVSLHRH